MELTVPANSTAYAAAELELSLHKSEPIFVMIEIARHFNIGRI